MDKMWAGRFEKALDKTADDFNSSVHFDCRMYKQDIEGSIAHAAMLSKQGIISAGDAELIIKEALVRAEAFIDESKTKIDELAEYVAKTVIEKYNV